MPLINNSAVEKNEHGGTLTNNLRRLMQLAGISEAELARKTNTPQPTLHKILAGKTEDPRASTLKALADFFNLSIDELLSNMTHYQSSSNSQGQTQSIPVISWKDCINSIPFITTLNPNNWDNWVVSEPVAKHAYGLVSKSSMEPRIPKGTILIIDPELAFEDGDMVIVHYPNTTEATLRKISADGPNTILLPINQNSEQTKLESNMIILGVLIKSTFTYHL